MHADSVSGSSGLSAVARRRLRNNDQSTAPAPQPQVIVSTALKHARDPGSRDQQQSKRQKEESRSGINYGRLSSDGAAADKAATNEFASIAPEVQTLHDSGKLEVLSNGKLKAFGVKGRV
jgi:hypothetical protein